MGDLLTSMQALGPGRLLLIGAATRILAGRRRT
jgi:hypothetical protein